MVVLSGRLFNMRRAFRWVLPPNGTQPLRSGAFRTTLSSIQSALLRERLKKMRAKIVGFNGVGATQELGSAGDQTVAPNSKEYGGSGRALLICWKAGISLSCGTSAAGSFATFSRYQPKVQS